MKKITIDVQHLTKVFSGLRAVNDVSLKIASGEFFGLLGPNGSGKTTMIKCMTGQIKPSEGSITVLGINALKDPIKVRELCGIIPEQENPPSFLTAVEYLYYVGKIRKIEKLEEKTAHWLKLLDFADQKDILCKDLSRGTRQKLMFAQAFIHEPKLAFIDEPLINLDPLTQKKVRMHNQSWKRNRQHHVEDWRKHSCHKNNNHNYQREKQEQQITNYIGVHPCLLFYHVSKQI